MPGNLYLLMGDETLELTIKAVEHNRWIQCFKSFSQILGQERRKQWTRSQSVERWNHLGKADDRKIREEAEKD